MTSRRIHLTKQEINSAVDKLKKSKSGEEHLNERPGVQSKTKNCLLEFVDRADILMKSLKEANQAFEDYVRIQNGKDFARGDLLKEPPEELKCPVCLELFGGNIFLCSNGHSVCAGCFSKIKTCGECRVPYGEARLRNRALERVVENFREGSRVQMLTGDEQFLKSRRKLMNINYMLEEKNKEIVDVHSAWKKEHAEEMKRIQDIYASEKMIYKKPQPLLWDSIEKLSISKYKGPSFGDKYN